MICPVCGAENTGDARFCAKCGSALAARAEEPSSLPVVEEPEPLPTSAAHAAPAAQPVAPAPADDDVYEGGDWKEILSNTVTAKVNEAAGGTGAVQLRYGDFFREVFKHHEKGEAERIFVCGTKETTPAISEVSTKWPRPWLYSRVLLLFVVITALFAAGAQVFDNFIGLSGLVMSGALAAPLAVTVFFFECNALRNVSFLEVAQVFLLGGSVAVLAAIGLESVVATGPVATSQLASAAAIAVIEELAKVAVMAFFLMRLKGRNFILSGMLVGAAVAGAFGAFETAGYAMRWWWEYGLQESMSLILTRSGLALGCHVAWGAIEGGALTLASDGRDFSFEQVTSPNCLIFLAVSVVLHFFWNFQIPLFSDIPFLGDSSQQAIITAFAWIVISVLLSRGLDQVNQMTGATRQ